MSRHQKEKSAAFKRILSVVLMGAVCLTAAATVAAMANPVEVVDVNLVEENERPDGKNIPVEKLTIGDPYEDKTMKAFKMDVKKNDSQALAEKAEMSTEPNDIEWRSIKLDLRGKKMNKQVPAGTVEDVLAYLDIELTEYDSMNVYLDWEVEDGDEIIITRTVVLTVEEEQDIKFETIKKEDKTLYEGDSIVRKPGKNGKKLATVEKVYINGKLDSKTELYSEVLEEPVDKIMVVGTKKKADDDDNDDYDEYENDSNEQEYEDHFSDNGDVTDNGDGQTFTDAAGVVRSYVQVLTGSGTAYYAEPGAGTATGRLAQYGVVAVNPNIIPYGSKLYIVSNDGEIVYGEAVAGDTGGALMDGSAIVDLYYPTYDECCVFGRRDVTIYVLEYGNEFR